MAVKELLLQMQASTRLGLYEGMGRAKLVADLQAVIERLDATHDSPQYGGEVEPTAPQ